MLDHKLLSEELHLTTMFPHLVRQRSLHVGTQEPPHTLQEGGLLPTL